MEPDRSSADKSSSTGDDRRQRLVFILFLGGLLLMAPFLFRSHNTEVEAVRRVKAAVEKAEQPIVATYDPKRARVSPEGSIALIEQFGRDLRAIDMAETPRALRELLEEYIAAIDTNVQARREQWQSGRSMR
jgi:hypothetical protein